MVIYDNTLLHTTLFLYFYIYLKTKTTTFHLFLYNIYYIIYIKAISGYQFFLTTLKAVSTISGQLIIAHLFTPNNDKVRKKNQDGQFRNKFAAYIGDYIKK